RGCSSTWRRRVIRSTAGSRANARRRKAAGKNFQSAPPPTDAGFSVDNGAQWEVIMKLYMHPVSMTSRPVSLFIAENKLACEQEVVDLMKGAHHQEPYA